MFDFSRHVAAFLPLTLLLVGSDAVAQPMRQAGRPLGQLPADTELLRQIEQRVLPPALVPGPPAHRDLPSYYAAANPKLRDRFQRIKSLYESSPDRVCRAITLVAGDAGVGKTFLKKEVFSKSYPSEEVLKLDIHEQYELWLQEGTVQFQPDLHGGEMVINRLLARDNPRDEPLFEMLRLSPAKFIVIDSIDELHPDDYVSTLRQLEKLAQLPDRTFQHIVVFGRPFAFIEYWEGVREISGPLDIQLFMLNPPQMRTTGDLLVSSWNYCNWKFGAQSRLDNGETAPLSFEEYVKWSEADFARSAVFENIVCQTNGELDPRVRDELIEYARAQRILGPLLCNLAGNTILREIVANRVRAGLPFDERQVMDAYFQAWLERDFQSDGRPSFQHPDHLDLYLQLLEQVAVKYAVAARLDHNGCFAVTDSDCVQVMHQDHQLSFPVQRILDRSGLKHIDPRQSAPRRYRFEPIWMHRYLVQRHNERQTEALSVAPLSGR